MSFDGSEINFWIAFIAGVITFFASCLLPLVPTYLAYLSGLSVLETGYKKRIVINGLIFTLGFILVFVILGATVNSFGRSLSINRGVLQKVGGLFFVVLGLLMTGTIKHASLLKEFKITLPQNLTKWEKLNSFLVGITFGFAWTPCIGPVLAVILFWASQAKTVYLGIWMLFAYGLGLGLPFLIVALGFEKLVPLIKKSGKASKIIQIASGIIIMLTGIALFTGNIFALSLKLIEIFGLGRYAV